MNLHSMHSSVLNPSKITRPVKSFKLQCSKTVFQSHKHISISLADVEDCVCAVDKLNIFDKIDCASSMGVNYVNVLNYLKIVKSLNKSFYTKQSHQNFLWKLLDIYINP